MIGHCLSLHRRTLHGLNSYLVIANNDVSSNVQYNLRKTIGQKNMIVSCKQILICNNHHNPNSLKCDE